MPMITPIPAFNDNYIWAIVHPDTKQMAVVDPGDAAPVLAFLSEHQLTLTHILITHHHFDHTGGIKALIKASDALVVGPHNKQIHGLDYTLSEGDTLDIPGLDCHFSIIEVPGHTLDHIAYVSDNELFCGDTLFSGGCGRVFEGTYEQMYHSLKKINMLPDNLSIYCTHEYTLANLKFAASIEPSNKDLQEYTQKVIQLRENNLPSLPSRLSLEQKINPFLRCNEPTVIQAANGNSQQALADPIAVFTALRQMKDNF